MSQQAIQPDPQSPHLVHGDALLQQLRNGWAPLPKKTLVGMAMGALRVRMMRSTVTMLSVVLAIAFLSYTLLNDSLEYNLARQQSELLNFTAVPQDRVAAASGRLAAADPFAGLAVDQQRAIAGRLGLDDPSAAEDELMGLPGKITKAEVEAKDAAARLAALEQDLAQGNDVPPQDVEVARSQVVTTTEALRDLQESHARYTSQVELANWIRSGEAASAGDLPRRLSATLTEHYQGLVQRLNSPSKLTDADFAAIDELEPLVQGRASAEDLAIVDRVVSEEGRKRAASDLITMLRKAGVNIQQKLTGTDHLATWIIVMALLTCMIGIANAMLMSVAERYREIGTMKCLGAQDSMVIQLFLLESAALGVVGAILGILLGILVAIVAGTLQYGGYAVEYFPWSQTGWAVLWSVLSGMILTVAGAAGPAYMASRMKPVDALRVEE